MERIGLGIIGLGTVGRGTYKILKEQNQLIKERSGIEIGLIKVADIDIERKKDLDSEELFTLDPYEVIENKEIDIVIELIGGIDEAYKYITETLKRGKWVVTANKALLSERGDEIFSLAEEKGCEIGFEASVCGGIPIIKAIRDGLIANKITYILGIFNGTTNYILSRMAKEGIPFEEVLREAQRLGFAERDPKFDIEGIDTAHKLCIITRLALQFPLKIEDIKVEGISFIEPIDLEFAKEFGYKIKLLGLVREREGKIEARVEPTMISINHPLANVEGVFNAVYVEGDRTGPTLYYGKGAGADPTGSAVVSDILDMAKRYRTKSPRFYRIKRMGREATKGYEFFYPFYMRLYAKDKPGVLSRISGILGECNISISAVIQKGRKENGYVPIVMLLHETKEEALIRAKEKIDSLDILKGKSIYLRIEEEGG